MYKLLCLQFFLETMVLSKILYYSGMSTFYSPSNLKKDIPQY